jgi:hypothetical protein
MALSTVIGDLITLRGMTYQAYRSGLGPDGQTLPRRIPDRGRHRHHIPRPPRRNGTGRDDMGPVEAMLDRR